METNGIIPGFPPPNKGQENLASNCARIEMFTEIRITPTLACRVRHSGHKKRKASCSESFHIQNRAASAISVGWFPYGHLHRLCDSSWDCCFTIKLLRSGENDRMTRRNWNVTSVYLTNLVSLLRMNSVGIVWGRQLENCLLVLGRQQVLCFSDRPQLGHTDLLIPAFDVACCCGALETHIAFLALCVVWGRQ